MQNPRIALVVNSCITNDPCALCGSRCDPCGLDYALRSRKPGRRLVCDTCAAKHAPSIVEARDAALQFAKSECETLEANFTPPPGIRDFETLFALSKHLMAALTLMRPNINEPDKREGDLPF